MFAQQQMQPTPESQLLQYQAAQQPQQPFLDAQQQQQFAQMQAAQGIPFQMQHNMSFSHESPFIQQQEMPYHGHARLESVAAGSGPEMGDDKRRKGSAATATNDKELREMITHMIQLNPDKRYSAEQYLEFWKGKVFPEYFYSFLHQYMEVITDLSPGRPSSSGAARDLGEADVVREADEEHGRLGWDLGGRSVQVLRDSVHGFWRWGCTEGLG